MTYHIEDWMGNEKNLLGKTEFDSFEDAREEIYEFAHILCNTAIDNGKYKADSQEYEDAFNGICEDLYAIENKEEA